MSSAREKFERRVGPALAGVTEPGERVVASGFGMVRPSLRAHLLVGAFAVFTMRQYWVTVTDRRLILLRMSKMGTVPTLELAIPREKVQVQKSRRGVLDFALALGLGDTTYPLRFPMQWKQQGEAIAAELGANPSAA